MITRSRKDWSVGATVKVGFLQLRVVGFRAVFDGMPDIYDLESLDGSKQYEFIPHFDLWSPYGLEYMAANGLTRIN